MLALHALHQPKPRDTQPFHPGAPGYWPGRATRVPGLTTRTATRALAALALGLAIAGCQANTAPAPIVERPVQVQRVAFAAEDGKRDFVGIVRARYETDLGFRVPG